jgi:MATE family multidrug resistance protein
MSLATRFDPHGFRQELAAMWRLAVPVVTVQVGMMLMGVVDSMMVGRVSATALAGAALGNVYFFAVAIFGVGTLMALDPVIAQAVGARDDVAVARGLQRGLVLAVLLGVPASLLMLPGEPILRLARQPEEFAPLAAAYAAVQVFGVLPFYLFVVLRQTLQALHRVRPVVITIVAANLANVGLNWAFIFGHLGLPPMGLVGSSWATVISRWLMALGLLAIAWRELRPRLVPWRPETLAARPLVRMLALGAPIGAQHQLEFGIFGVVGLLMGWLGAEAMAGHQIALNLASITFMVPLGVSGAAAVLVGHAVGRGDQAEARRAALAGLLLGVGFMAASAAVMVAAPWPLARLYTADAAVLSIAIVLLPLAGLFQVFDGTQVVSIGILRGTGDTRTPMIVNVVGFWLVGLPISAWLGLLTDLGPRGLWWGLVVGLAAVALILLVRVRRRLAGEIGRVLIDEHPSGAAAPT